MADIKLDALNLKCPMPVLKTKAELKKMNAGQTLEVIANDKGALKDIPALLSKTGDELVEAREDNGNVIFIIKKA
jgi:tRNA 2-thiouridine synthesizing protein A